MEGEGVFCHRWVGRRVEGEGVFCHRWVGEGWRERVYSVIGG